MKLASIVCMILCLCGHTSEMVQVERASHCVCMAGREAFMGEVFKHVEEYGGNICSQLRRMGASTDWSRQVPPARSPPLLRRPVECNCEQALLQPPEVQSYELDV